MTSEISNWNRVWDTMTGIPLKVLFIEDNEDHAFLVIHELKKGGYEPDLLRTDTLASVKSALDSGEWDVILCDYALPGFTGVDVLREYNDRNLDIPFIIISGEIGEDTAVTLMKSGAHDYVFKGNLKPLTPVIKREIGDANNRKERRELDRLREAESIKYRVMIDAAFDAIALIDKGQIIECNSMTKDIFGIPSDEKILGTNLIERAPPVQPDGMASQTFLERKYQAAAMGTPQDFECQLLRHGGEIFDAEITLKQILLPDIKPVQMTIRDITDRKRVEREMKGQMEKIMELQQQEMTMINQNPLPLLLMDLEMRILKVNESFLTMSGYREQQLLSMRAHDFKVLEKKGHGLKDALRTKKAVSGDLKVEFPAGIHYIEQDIIPLLDNKENVVSIMSTYKDRTEEIRKEQEIQRMITEAEEHAGALSRSADDLGTALASVARGDMTVEVSIQENDPLKAVKENASSTIKALRATLVEVNHVSGNVSDNMREINNGSTEISNALQKISGTTRQSTENGRDLLAHMGEITDQISTLSASNEEITSTSQEILRHARDVAVRGAEAQKLGNETNDRMMLVTKIAQESVEDIDELNHQIHEITKIVKMINDIAGQINLLALNAAIEAARAGDAGRGFAVVAGEVKNLAADARQATDHIGDVINAIQRSSEKTSSAIRSSHDEIAHGVDSVAKTIESLNLMVSGASEVTRDMDEIVKAIEDQANIATSVVNTAQEGIRLTTDNLEQIESLYSLAEEVTASVEEINSAIIEVDTLSSELNEQMSKFRV